MRFKFTLCFLTRGSRVLMLHRANPPNQGLWNGVGGHLLAGESPREACLREVFEETGYRLATVRFAGLLTWTGFEIPDGGLYLFTAPAPVGEPLTTLEGRLAWHKQDWVVRSSRVVSNIHRFGPHVFSGSPAQRYHFDYLDGMIHNWGIHPLPPDLSIE